MSRAVETLKNLGPRSAEWLRDIGVHSREDVERLGSVEIYRLLKERGRGVTLNLVWGIEAMLRDIDWRELPLDVKAELRLAIRKL